MMVSGGVAVTNTSPCTTVRPAGIVMSERKKEYIGNTAELFFGAQIGLACHVESAVKNSCFEEVTTDVDEMLA
jgi:hypothetical protein